MQRIRRLHFAELDSTNAYAAAHLHSLADGDLVTAEVQTAGRGRLQRSWVSHAPGNVYASLVLKPSARLTPDLPLASLTQYLSVVLCRTLEDDGVAATIKWPNDVQVQGRKIAGILSEARIVGAELLGVILGFGINLNQRAEVMAAVDQPATSLNLLTGVPVDRDAFLDRLAAGFLAQYPRFLSEGFESIRDEYRRRSPFLGCAVELDNQGERLAGRALDFDATGALLVEDATGRIQAVQAGDLVWRGVARGASR